MNNFDTDFTCLTSLPYDINTFPSVTSRNTFNLDTFGQQISALEETATEEELLLYQYPLPSVESVKAAERDVFSSFGDKRFNGAAAYDFLFTRYRALGLEDLTSTVLVASACNADGDPYTYYIPNSATYYDSANKSVTLPVYDARGHQVEFPLKDQYGSYLLAPAPTAIDNKNMLVVFPLTDVKGSPVTFPFKGATGDVIIVPPRNTEQLLNVPEAYKSLDTAYSKAKDYHAYQFAEYIFNLESEDLKRVGFFYSDVQIPAQSATAPIFAAAIYSTAATDTDLIDITSSSIEKLIRYYPDRAEFTYSHYQDIGGTGPYTVVSPTTSANIRDLVQSENAKLASFNILSSPLWSSDVPYEQYYSAPAGPGGSITHTSILDLSNKVTDNSTDITGLQNQINSLSATIDVLFSQLTSLSAKYEATNTNVVYNSGIVDTLVDTPRLNLNWLNLWNTGYPAPSIPLPR